MALANERTRRRVSVGLWIAQGTLALLFVGTGVWKLATPIERLAAMIPWAGQVSPTFLRVTAVVDLAGGLGIVLPSLTRVAPKVTVLAALGCALLQLCAVVFHVSRGEGANTPFNVFLSVLAVFVAWGRAWGAPIAAPPLGRSPLHRP